jgi:hypothetical protein
MPNTPISAILVGAGWLLRELAGALFAEIKDNLGAVKFIPDESGFFVETSGENGERLEARYFPRNLYKRLSHTLSCRGTFVNSTKRPVFLHDPSVEFYSPSGLQLTYETPRLSVEGVRVPVLEIGPQTSRYVRVDMILAPDSVEQLAGTLPVLSMTLGLTGQRRRQFRLSHSSFHGPVLTVWPRKGPLPVPNVRGQVWVPPLPSVPPRPTRDPE